MLTSEDRRNVRQGAMRTKGAQWASLIFWALALPRILAVLLGLAAVVAMIVLLHSWWTGTLGPWLQTEDGSLKVSLIVVAAVFVVLALRRLLRPRSYGRRGQR